MCVIKNVINYICVFFTKKSWKFWTLQNTNLTYVQRTVWNMISLKNGGNSPIKSDITTINHKKRHLQTADADYKCRFL